MPRHTSTEPPNQRVLSAFSSCLLALGDVTHAEPVERILEQAMRTLAPLVRFDRAWWGQVAGQEGDARNWLQGHIGLTPQFGDEWNCLAAGDEFGQGSMRRLGQVIRSVEGEEAPPNIYAFCERHDLRHAMAITLELPGSGQLFFVSLYRATGRPNFSDQDAGLFAEFASHLMQGWRRRLAAIHTRLAAPSWDSFAVADAASGHLLYLGRRAAVELKHAFPSWRGWVLPDMATRVPASITVQRIGPLVAVLCARKAMRRAGLSPAQWSVAALYAQGHTSTAVAQRLGLTPATVRTYLRDVYAQLVVGNKIDLQAALNDTSR